MPDPKPKDLHLQLRTIFAEEDASLVMEILERIKARGFGRMVIGFKNGDTDIFEETFTYKPPRHAKNYVSE